MHSRRSFIYILTNQHNNALYTGVTNDLPNRMQQHKQLQGSSFTTKYKVTKLVYYEEHPTIIDAIAREKYIKNLLRKKKIQLINTLNPTWRDLFEEL